MKLQQLRYLLAIADNGLNITAAAEKLFTSQPGVSKQLKLLEEELGLPLFLRKGKSLGGVTGAGEQVIARARVVIREADNIRTLASSYYQEEEGTLSIAATHMQARYVLPAVVREFRDRYPQVNLKIHQGTSEQIVDMVRSNNIDFAIATGSHDLFRNLLLVPSFHWDRKIVVPVDHELARQKREITLKDLARFPLVTYVFSFGGQSMLKKAFAEQGLDPEVAFTARDADVIRTYVRMGLGVGIVAGMADDNEDEDLVTISATGLFPRSTTWIGFRKDMALRRYMLDFMRLFAPHITADQLELTRYARSQAEIDKLYAGSALPVLNGNASAHATTQLQSSA
ncbi:MAG: LysR substrate-binding domain-containing protein [Proteobacteria bacterium]|nr:LysR substrate-binding domain-containing protein [Pseudomonadota bacterium]